MDIFEYARRNQASAYLLAAIFFGGTFTSGAAAAICDEVTTDLANSAPAKRMMYAQNWLGADCPDVPATLWSAVEEGKWLAGGVVLPADRTLILRTLAEAGHERAIETVVSILETGNWPEGSPLYPAQGVSLVESLQGSLSSYHIRLLLDIYEQIPRVDVREAVLHTLSGAEYPAARVPALDAYWSSDSTLQLAGKAALASWSTDSADAQLLWTIDALKVGAILGWAKRLASENGVTEALKAAEKKAVEKGSGD